jgi:hypothetical protein
MDLRAALKVRRSAFAECVVYREGFREKLAKIELETIAGFVCWKLSEIDCNCRVPDLTASRVKRVEPPGSVGVTTGAKGMNTIASLQTHAAARP